MNRRVIDTPHGAVDVTSLADGYVEVDYVNMEATGDVIQGVTTTPAMIEAGAKRLAELLAEGASLETMAEEVHFVMRQAAGEGRALRRVGPAR